MGAPWDLPLALSRPGAVHAFRSLPLLALPQGHGERARDQPDRRAGEPGVDRGHGAGRHRQSLALLERSAGHQDGGPGPSGRTAPQRQLPSSTSSAMIKLLS